MKDEELQKIRIKLESSTNVLFEKISEFLIHEITESCEKKKLDDLIQNEMYSNRAKVEKYFRNRKISKKDLEELRGFWSELCVKKKQEIESQIPWLKDQYEIKLIQRAYSAPNIKDIEYETFSAKINTKKNPNLKFEKEQVCDKLIYYANVMPTYFLVEEEIEAIFYYIKNLK